MNHLRRIFLFAILTAFLLSAPASAAVLYNNNPGNDINNQLGISGLISAYPISYGYAQIGYKVSDSFTLASPSAIAGVSFGAWFYPGDTPESVQWGISTAPDDTNNGSATLPTASLSNTVWCNPCTGSMWAIDISSFSFTVPIDLSAGTYYLTLQSVQTSLSEGLLWDVNDGPSTAYLDGASFASDGHTNSNAFEILSAPEPAGIVLIAPGLLLAGAFVRRKIRG